MRLNQLVGKRLISSASLKGLFENLAFIKAVDKAYKEDGSTRLCTIDAGLVYWIQGARSTKIYGFSISENPNTRFEELDDDPNEGHHFAVVQDRYIVDLWVRDMGWSKRVVFDVEDKSQANEIKAIYGDPSKWTRLPQVERSFDNDDFPIKGMKKAVSEFVK